MARSRSISADVRERLVALETELPHVNEKLDRLQEQSGKSAGELHEIKSDLSKLQSYGKALVKLAAALVLFYLSNGNDSEALSNLLKTLLPGLFGAQ